MPRHAAGQAGLHQPLSSIATRRLSHSACTGDAGEAEGTPPQGAGTQLEELDRLLGQAGHLLQEHHRLYARYEEVAAGHQTHKQH